MMVFKKTLFLHVSLGFPFGWSSRQVSQERSTASRCHSTTFWQFLSWFILIPIKKHAQDIPGCRKATIAWATTCVAMEILLSKIFPSSPSKARMQHGQVDLGLSHLSRVRWDWKIDKRNYGMSGMSQTKKPTRLSKNLEASYKFI